MTWSSPSESFGDDAGVPGVRLTYHDARWKQEFEQTRSGLFQSCDGAVIDVEHVGSTAIGGLIARPIIDLVAVVAEHEHHRWDATRRSIEGLNFRVVPSPSWAESVPDTVWLEKPRHGEPTHRVLVVRGDHDLRRRMVAVRDHFRENPEVAVRFEELKVSRWKQSEGDFAAYEAAKAAFLTHLEDQLGIGSR